MVKAKGIGKSVETPISTRPFVEALLDPAARVLSYDEAERRFARDRDRTARPFPL